jgi:predicted nucleic acid-binding protein
VRKIIVDSNIIFSALLTPNGTNSDLIFNPRKAFRFYTCYYLRFEIRKHWNRIKQISKLNDKELRSSLKQLFEKIEFINDKEIPLAIWREAGAIVQDIDLDDIDFIALTNHLNGFLWTGDLELYSGLKKKNFKRVFTTREMLEIRKRKTGK